VAVEALDAKVAEIVKALVNNSPHAVQQAKVLVREVAGKKSTMRCWPIRPSASRKSAPRTRAAKAWLPSSKRKPAWLL
jgi:methylglutaconyl-CoA hydratase